MKQWARMTIIFLLVNCQGIPPWPVFVIVVEKQESNISLHIQIIFLMFQ